MAKYLVIASYTPEGMRGVLAQGGTARREAVEKAVADLGGHVDSFYFAFGDDDVYTVIDLPDSVTAAAVGMTVGASGMVRLRTVVLLTTEEIDRAANLQIAYRPPGK